MWLGINFFVGSQAPLAKKKQFGELSTEEIQEIMDNTIPVTTKKSIPVETGTANCKHDGKAVVKFGMRIINGMCLFKFPLKAVKFQT